jgi:hypothetical protein
MAVIESNNRILRAGDSPVGTRYFDGDYIHIDENNHINFTGDFSGLSAKVDECCADAHGQISAIKGSVSSLSSQFVDCCSSVNTDLTEIWNAVNVNSANITNNSNNISTLSGNTALLDSIKLDISAYTEAETVPWITAWKNVSNNLTANFGDTYCFLSSIDVSGNKNHAVGVKGSYITLPTTGHIASALDSKFDTSSFNNFIENGFNPNMTELHGATSYISSFVNTGCVHNSALNYTEDDKISGISGIPLVGNGGGDAIWISGNKEIGPEILLDFGNAIQVISSFTVSGDHNHAIALKGSQFKLPSTAHISAALEDRLPISSFSSYTANADSRMDGIFQLANSAYTTAVNNYYNKADKSALSSYVPYSAIGGTTNIITGINGSALSAGANYTEGPNIKITGNEISGKDWTDDITAASSYAYNQATASIPSVQEYSAGDNIDITNHVVSGKDWSSEISDASANAVNEAINNITAVSYAATANISNSALTANYALSSDSATYDSDGNKITETYLSALPEGVITTANTFVSSVNNLTPELVSGGINGHELKLSGSTPTGLPLSGVDPIKIEKTGGKVVISITGNVGNTYDVTAGANINVATAGNTFTVSGKDWTDTITAASSYAASQAQGKTYAGVAPIVVDNVEDKISANVAVLTAEAPVYIESSNDGTYDYHTIKYSGLRFSNVLGGTDLSNATASITYERANLPMTTDWYRLNIGNVSGNTGSFSLIPSDITSGFLYSIGNGGISTKKINDPKIFNHRFTTGEPSFNAWLGDSDYYEAHFSTPHIYGGPSQYTATLDGLTFILESGAFYVFVYQALYDDLDRWFMAQSGYYNV